MISLACRRARVDDALAVDESRLMIVTITNIIQAACCASLECRPPPHGPRTRQLDRAGPDGGGAGARSRAEEEEQEANKHGRLWRGCVPSEV